MVLVSLTLGIAMNFSLTEDTLEISVVPRTFWRTRTQKLSMFYPELEIIVMGNCYFQVYHGTLFPVSGINLKVIVTGPFGT